ncbi:Domain of unknown function DUF1813 HSP20-like protein [Dickeya chrysanthemi Ech1591]|uniref:Uncharacterized protein n=1 Tax=Dickeya chrysanthemi (strain Ech1591) TaxID=561229 RepID=C6CNV8_DICC1|nr:Domain of unknown function DUF1813 HSP20-like protein [Dickeya chrysanthemi Ech1591]
MRPESSLPLPVTSTVVRAVIVARQAPPSVHGLWFCNDKPKGLSASGRPAGTDPDRHALAQAGFTAGTLFRISLYRNGLMLTRLDDDTDIAALVAELDGNETEGADWVSDNGELTLAGDWLTQSGLLTPPFSIEALPGKIMIRAEPDVMLA